MAFEAAIIAFLIPLSIEIISKISERYNSDVIIRTFENSWENKILPHFLLVNIGIAIILRFLHQGHKILPTEKILDWTVLMMFIFIAFAILRVIKRTKSFISNTKYILNQLYENIENSLK